MGARCALKTALLVFCVTKRHAVSSLRLGMNPQAIGLRWMNPAFK